MRDVKGRITCQAAAFVYKDDRTALQAWQDICHISHIRAEIHNDRTSFLTELAAWNTQVTLTPGNAYLGLYAHMGKPGISPKGTKDPGFSHANVVSWTDLAAALPNGVHTCWLVGCKSEAVLSVWKPAITPVVGHLLVTIKSEAWQPLVKFFADEISLSPINYPENMPARLRKALPALGMAIKYYEPTTSGWKPCFF